MCRKCRRPHFAKNKDNSDIPPPGETIDRPSLSTYSVADNDFIDETTNNKDNEEAKVT